MTDTTPAAALDRLIDAGVVREHDDGSLTTDPDFEDTRRVYADTYADCSEETFRSTVAELFELPEEAAGDRIEETGVTRAEVVAFLTLRSVLDAPPEPETLAVMSRVVLSVEPASVVPRQLRRVGEGEFEAFVETHPDTVFTVWKQACEPCDAMKEDLDAILEVIPDDVAVAGVDGEAVPEFRREFDVTAAPSLVVVRDGEHVLTESGRQSPTAVSKVVEDFF